MPEIFRADPADIEIPRRVLAARLGFRGVGDIPEEFKPFFDRAYGIALKVATPLALYGNFKPRDLEDGVVVEGKEIRGRLASQHLKGRKTVTLILATLGSRFDEEISRLHSEGEELLSFFLDGIGSEMVEYFARMLDSKLREEMGEGSARISPGYVDLPLSLNAWIIEKLSAKDWGITYDPETFIMHPRKTISALIGWS